MNRRFPTDVAEMGELIDLYVADRLVPQIEIVLERSYPATLPRILHDLPSLREPSKRDWEKRQKQRSKRRSKR